MNTIIEETLKDKLSSGRTVYGTLITSGTSARRNAAIGCGLDFVFVDTEHISLDRGELSQICRSYQANHITPIVRILSPDPYRASQAIDDGALGVIAPYLETEDQIRDLVGATKLRPLKGEKLKRIQDGSELITDDLKCYLEEYNRGVLTIANIESIPAVDNLEKLLGIDGLDAVFIGPHDLSINMGIPEQYDHPDFIAAVRSIIKAARKYTLGVGIHFSLEPERQIFWIREGVNIVVHSSDMALFQQKLTADLHIIRTAAGDAGLIEPKPPGLVI
jgi:2-keto-3-deoxy-L-rhamnonate aldolase RhmA